MASKKSGKAAGLAALAGLAYMASQGKDKKEAPSDSSYDALERKRMPAKAEDATESGDFMSRRLNRIDTDDGRAYSTNNLSPMSSGKAAPTSVARTPTTRTPTETPVRTQQELDASGQTMIAKQNKEAAMDKLHSSYVPDTRYKLRDVVKTSGDKSSNYSNKSLKQEGFEPRDPGGAGKRGSLNEPTDDFKKGGKVKKMASGGMTSSASKRGDGIASKGKTRCKMY